MKVRRGVVILVVVLVLIGIVALLIPHFLDADTYRGRIESALSESLGRKVTLGHLQFSLFSGSLVAQNASIADDPRYSRDPFLQASRIKIGVEVKPLIFDRQLHITGFEIDDPKVSLLRASNGVWNYSSLGNKDKRTTSAQTQSTLPDLNIAQIIVKNGSVTVGDLPQVGKPRVFTALNATIQRFSLTHWFPFSVSAHVPTNGSLLVTGTAGPIDQKDASLTPVNAEVTLKNVDPVAAGFVDPGQGIAGILNLQAKAVSNGRTLNANGTLEADHLQLSKDGSPSPAPVHVQFAIAQDLAALSGTVQKATVTIGKAVAEINGTYRTAGPNTDLNLHITGQNVPINELEAFLPALGVKLPSGSRLEGGTLTTSLDVTGPAQNPTLHGPLSIQNTQLANFDLGSKLASISALTGAKTGSATVIRSLTTDLTLSPAGTRTDNLQIAVVGLGTAAGNGSISAGGALNYQLIIKLAQGAGVGGAATQLAGLLPGMAGNAIGHTLQNGIPVSIRGTTSSPTFTPDLGGLGRATGSRIAVPGRANNPVGSIVNQIFGKH